MELHVFLGICFWQKLALKKNLNTISTVKKKPGCNSYGLAYFILLIRNVRSVFLKKGVTLFLHISVNRIPLVFRYGWAVRFQAHESLKEMIRWESKETWPLLTSDSDISIPLSWNISLQGHSSSFHGNVFALFTFIWATYKIHPGPLPYRESRSMALSSMSHSLLQILRDSK